MSSVRVAGAVGAIVATLCLGLVGCSGSSDLDGTYTRIESSNDSSLESTLTMDGGDCAFHHVAQPGGEHQDEACSVDGDFLVFTKDGSEARIPVDRVDGGSLRIGVGDGEVYEPTS